MKTALIYNDSMTGYDLGPQHPLRPERLRLTRDLLSAYGLLGDESSQLEAEPASDPDILSFHTKEYIRVVRDLSNGERVSNALDYGFGYGDNPPFPGMYEASLLYTGASLLAADLVVGGQFGCAFSIAGGLHHAHAGAASGFCVFNDPVIVIKRLLQSVDRVAYIDIDAHHGDGVQEAFYGTDRVLTVSFHETGQYLFPGTGFTHEIGQGHGRGYSINMPLFPYTTDDIYTQCFREVVPPILSAYKPDVIVAQLGVDTHFGDPITHLALTSAGFLATVEAIVDARRPLVTLGGGGYNIQVVPRLWTLAYARMIGRDLSDHIPVDFARRTGIYRLRDSFTSDDRLDESQITAARDYAEQSVSDVKRLVFPIHGIRS